MALSGVMSITDAGGWGKPRKPLKRTPFKRKAPVAFKTRTPLKARSDRRAELYRTERVPIIKTAVENGQLCQACSLIADIDMAAAAKCDIRAVDWHERKSRSRAGGSDASLMSPANRVWTCRPGHNWITTHPIEARSVGLVLNSWDADPE